MAVMGMTFSTIGTTVVMGCLFILNVVLSGAKYTLYATGQFLRAHATVAHGMVRSRQVQRSFHAKRNVSIRGAGFRRFRHRASCVHWRSNYLSPANIWGFAKFWSFWAPWCCYQYMRLLSYYCARLFARDLLSLPFAVYGLLAQYLLGGDFSGYTSSSSVALWVYFQLVLFSLVIWDTVALVSGLRYYSFKAGGSQHPLPDIHTPSPGVHVPCVRHLTLYQTLHRSLPFLMGTAGVKRVDLSAPLPSNGCGVDDFKGCGLWDSGADISVTNDKTLLTNLVPCKGVYFSQQEQMSPS